MAVVDKRNKAEAYDGGSSQVALWLDAAAVAAIYPDASPLEGWYMPSFQLQSEYGPDRDSEEVKDEADNLIKTRTNRDEFVLITTFFQSTDEVIRLIEYFEQAANATLLRYPLPTNDDDETQWLFGYNATIRKENWRVAAQNAQDRTIQVTFVFSRDADGNIKDIATLPESQVDAAWDDYGAFKDTPD